jgi:hypothetical protein
VTQPLLAPPLQPPLLSPNVTWASPTPADNGLGEYIQDVIKPAMQRERMRLQPFQKWMDGAQMPDYKVQGREDEKRVLLRLSKAPWLGLAVSVFSQSLFVDGYRASGSRTNAPVWDTWTSNGWEAQQSAIHRDAIGFGYSYARALPGIDPLTGQDRTMLRGVSPLRGFSLFDDPVADAYPLWFLEILPDCKTLRWYDNEVYRDFIPGEDAGDLKLVQVVEHNAGVCPVVRYVNRMNLDGEPFGDIEPVIGLAAKIDKTGYDRLLSQHFNSWRVRYATGVEQGDTDEEVEEDREKLENNTMLASENPEARFGTLDQTELSGFIDAQKADVYDLFANMQLPADIAAQQISNVGPDALAASRKSFTQKVFEKQSSFGITHARLLRLAAGMEGDIEASRDFKARVHWQDTDTRSLAQAADAWGKIVTMLKVPAWGAWQHLPDVDPEEVDTWLEHLMDSDPTSVYLREIVQPPAATQNTTRDANADGSTGSAGN